MKQPLCIKKIDVKETIKNNFIKECKDHIKKNYLNRNIFSRLIARHNGRAMALIQALDRCSSVKEAKKLIKNQCDLFEKGRAARISSGLLVSRWSMELKKKPYNISKSSFYGVLNTMPGRQRPVLFRNTPQISTMPRRLRGHL